MMLDFLIFEPQDDARGRGHKDLSNSSMRLLLIKMSQCLCKFALNAIIADYLYKFNERS